MEKKGKKCNKSYLEEQHNYQGALGKNQEAAISLKRRDTLVGVTAGVNTRQRRAGSRRRIGDTLDIGLGVPLNPDRALNVIRGRLVLNKALLDATLDISIEIPNKVQKRLHVILHLLHSFLLGSGAGGRRRRGRG